MLKLISSILTATITVSPSISKPIQIARIAQLEPPAKEVIIDKLETPANPNVDNTPVQPKEEVAINPKFISLNFITEQSAVGKSPKVKYIGLLDIHSGNFQGLNADSKPASLASTAKVVIALAVLDDLSTGKYKLSSKVTMPEYARATFGSYGPTVKSNIYRMLANSDNDATNALIVKAGGFDAINSKIKKYELNDTRINCMLSPKVSNSKTCIGTNLSTMRDLVYALNNIKIKGNLSSQYMISAMTDASRTFNHTNRVFNKYGINSKALADVGVIYIEKAGIRKEYIYAMNQEFTGNTGSGANYDNSTIGIKNPTKLTTDKKDSISKTIQWIVNDLQQGLKVYDGSR